MSNDQNMGGSEPNSDDGETAQSPSAFADRLKALNLVTMLAVVVTIGYAASFLFQDFMYSWWLMLAMPGAAGFLFWTQRDRTDGFEAKVCRIGLWTVLGLFIIRDAILTAQRTVLPEGILFVQ